MIVRIQWIFAVFLSILCSLHSERNETVHHRPHLPWCPPENFLTVRRATQRHLKTVFVTEVHGQLVQTGPFWGTILHGSLLARNIHYHIGVMGFDKMYINVIYNDTVHPTPPTVTELYPPSTSCVSAWHDVGVLEWRHVPYAGPRERWPLNDDQKPELNRDLYKTLRGINPIYDDIMKNKEADWVMVLDADEYLTPMNWRPTQPHWCSPHQPSILELALQQMLVTATTVDLQTYPLMLRAHGKPRNASEACLLGYGVSTGHAQPSCREIASIILPVRFWANRVRDNAKNARMPLLRARVPSAYPHIRDLNKSVVEETHQTHQWKSIHQTRFTPRLVGTQTMHYGHADAFKVVAPRPPYHSAATLEVAHVSRDRDCAADAECRSALVQDSYLQDLSRSYYSCMEGLARTKA